MKATKEIKFETAKDFLTANRVEVFSRIRTEFRFNMYDFNTIVAEYFAYILDSRYNEYFTLIMDAKTTCKVIENSVEAFKKTTNLPVNYTAKNDFIDEREADKRGSISY